MIVINATSKVTVDGHFNRVLGDENNRIEQIIFSDETITSAAELNSLM